jgi:hypothetical protein
LGGLFDFRVIPRGSQRPNNNENLETRSIDGTSLGRNWLAGVRSVGYQRQRHAQRDVLLPASGLTSCTSTGSLSEADALYGTIAFNGNGTYSFTNCLLYDSGYGLNTCAAFGVPTSGTYSIAASGYGFLSSPIPGGAVYGLVSQQGIFIGSSTESGFNDLFIAAPLASPAPTAATFKGSYWLADMDVANGIGSMFH